MPKFLKVIVMLVLCAVCLLLTTGFAISIVHTWTIDPSIINRNVSLMMNCFGLAGLLIAVTVTAGSLYGLYHVIVSKKNE